MKTLKLEVGKTYRSRKGEEVKIVRKGNKGWDHWEGSNGEWYYESGKWSYVTKEHPDDLIEEVPSEPTRHTFAIPNGVKEVTVEKVGNRIVVEMAPEREPKPGDVMINNWGSIYIFKAFIGDYNHEHYAWLGNDGRVFYSGIAEPGRPATSEEAKLLFDALKKEGKRWNPKTMQVEEITESDRIREWVAKRLGDGRYDQEWVAQVISHYLKYREGEK